MKILILDRDPVLTAELGSAVRLAEYDFRAFSDAGELLASGEHGECDILVAEWDMPGIGGIDGIRRLRDRFPEAGIILSAAEWSPKKLESVSHLGVIALLRRPVDPCLFLEAVFLVEEKAGLASF